MKKTGLFLSLIFVGSVVWGLSLSEIRTEIRFHVKDSNSSRQNYSDTILNRLINQTHRDVVNATWVIKKSTTIELVADTTYYTMPTDNIQIQRVTFREENMPESSLQELDGRFNDSSWSEQGGFPDRYFQDPALPESIGIYPWPDDSSSTGTLKINYFATANTLSSDSDEPFDGDDRYQQYTDLLVWFPVYHILSLEGVTAKAANFLALFQSRLDIMNRLLGERPNYYPSFGGKRSQ